MKTKLENGQKLGPQFRTFSILAEGADGEGQRVKVDADARLVEGVSVSSDEPYERFFGTEILKHTPEAVNLTRFKKKAAPLLLNHNREKLIGKPMNPRLEDGRLVVDLKFAQNALATEALRDLQDGILTECSIGYSVERFEVDEKEETYTATKWEVFECSMVSIPADYTVGVGREFAEEEKRVTIETKSVDTARNNENNDSQEREHSQTRETHMAEPAAPTAPEVDVNKERDLATKTERKRVSDIQELNRHFAEKGLAGRKIDTSKAAEEHIRDGKSVGEFQSFVMVNEFKDVQPLETPETRDLNDGSGKGIPRVEVGGERPYVVEARSLGELFVKSKEYRAKNRSEQKCVLEVNGLSNFRATFSTASSITGFNGAIVNAGGIIELGVQRPTVADLIGQGVTGLTAVPFMQETAITNAATAVAEGGAKPEATFALEQKTAPVKKIAVTIPVTDEAFEDIATLESYINGRLRWMVEMTEEAQLVSGDGAGANLTGILNTTGIQTQAKGADTALDAIRKARNLKVRAIGFAEPSGIVIHPNDWDELEGAKDANNQYFAGGPFTGSYGQPFVNVQRVWGMPVVVTTGITEGTALIGAFRTDAMIFRKKGITIDSTNSHASEFTSNIVRLRAEERLALAVFRPKSFCQITGI